MQYWNIHDTWTQTSVAQTCHGSNTQQGSIPWPRWVRDNREQKQTNKWYEIVSHILIPLSLLWLPSNYRIRKGGGKKREYGRISGEEDNADYGGMVQHRQQHVAPCIKGVASMLYYSHVLNFP